MEDVQTNEGHTIRGLIRSRLRLIGEVFGIVIILALTTLLVIDRSQPESRCPDGALLAKALDQAWYQTWDGSQSPQPDIVTKEIACWRVEAFDFSVAGKGEYRATRCANNTDFSQVEWSWSLWAPDGGQ